MLVGTVIIHEPDFFKAGARANESDLRGSDARRPPESLLMISSANW